MFELLLIKFYILIFIRLYFLFCYSLITTHEYKTVGMKDWAHPALSFWLALWCILVFLKICNLFGYSVREAPSRGNVLAYSSSSRLSSSLADFTTHNNIAFQMFGCHLQGSTMSQ